MAISNWTKEQTIVALATYFNVPFNKASNSNKEIQRIAKITGRSITSIKMKIGNFGSLDPELAKRGIKGLTGATNMDRAIWKEYNSDREKLAYESTVLIAQFSKESVDEVIQNEIPEVRMGIEVVRDIKVRVNQYFFRKNILGIYDNKCCITSLQIPELLVASHIVPWSKDKENRLNAENGLCLNAIHDKAFDCGLITIGTDYKVRLSKRLNEFHDDKTIDIFFKSYDGSKIMMPERYYPAKSFLEYHNQKIFQK
jgi:putative restriction endonuclease